MKTKNLILALLSLTCIFSACSSDDDKNTITLKESEKTLNYEQTYQIDAKSAGKITYKSQNEYHAMVSTSGMVKAGKIGETNIVISDGEDTQNFKVIVEPKSNLYPEPNLEFGISRSDLIKKLGKPDYEKENVIRYDNHSKNAPQALYLFDEDDKLDGSSVLLKIGLAEDVYDFLDERYSFVTYDKEELLFLFINALKLENTTMLVGFGPIDNSSIATLYKKYTYTPEKSGSNELNKDMDAIRKILAK